jgi:pyruvate dehydrogenase E1 component alpha subunit
MAELFGKLTGSSRGKGGSMHFFSAEKHLLGGNGIVEPNNPRHGVAWPRLTSLDGATLCFFGDGAFHQGPCTKASIWRKYGTFPSCT